MARRAENVRKLQMLYVGSSESLFFLKGPLEFFSINFHENLFISSRVGGQTFTAEPVVVLQLVVQ